MSFKLNRSEEFLSMVVIVLLVNRCTTPRRLMRIIDLANRSQRQDSKGETK
jgi:hypothetical protein